jgi:hypothetical protein
MVLIVFQFVGLIIMFHLTAKKEPEEHNFQVRFHINFGNINLR